MAENHGRFAHPPTITRQRRDYLEMRFRGVTSHLQGIVSKDGTAFHIVHAGRLLDMLECIDIVEHRCRDGTYCCALCLKPVHYASKQALWEGHCFEPMLEWANASFQAGQWLHAYATHDGSSWAALKPHGDCHHDAERFEFARAGARSVERKILKARHPCPN